MRVPDEFKHLTQCFWSGSDEEARDVHEWIGNALKLCGVEKHAVIKRFLDDVLSRNLDGAELQRIWNSGGPRYMIGNNEELRQFLGMIRDRIAVVGRR